MHVGGATNRLVWTNLTAGTYPVVAVATDSRGASRASAITVFKVNPTNPSPFVQITFPTNNAAFAPGSDVYIMANAWATNGGGTVTNVEFFVNGHSIGSDTHNPYSILKCCWKTGTYTLTAKATDNFGGWAIATNQLIIAQDSPVSSGCWDAEFGPECWLHF